MPSSINTCAVTAEAVRQARQAIRRARRERPGGADRRHRLRGADRRGELRRHARGRPRPRQCKRSSAPRATRPDSSATTARVRVNDIMSVRETGVASGRGDGRAGAGLRRGAERLRPPLHLLHHPLWPRQFALGADGRGRRADQQARRERLSRSRADRRRHHRLRRRPAGQAEPRQARPRHPPPCARSSSGCASPRSIRSRPTTR